MICFQSLFKIFKVFKKFSYTDCLKYTNNSNAEKSIFGILINQRISCQKLGIINILFASFFSTLNANNLLISNGVTIKCVMFTPFDVTFYSLQIYCSLQYTPLLTCIFRIEFRNFSTLSVD